MNREDDLQAHLRENFDLLSSVVRHEVDERKAVKKNLADFHAALSAHEKIYSAAIAERHAADLATLDAQIERLKKITTNHAPE